MVITFVSLAALRTITLPWSGTADSYDHLDYVYQVWHGDLPEPTGFEYRYPDGPTPRAADSRQFASAHPPGWYAILAPVMGPLLDAGRWRPAVAAGRMLATATGVVGMLLMAWTAWRIGGRVRHRAAVAVPALGGLTTYHLLFSGDIYNDVAATTCSIGAVGTSLVVLCHGLTRRRLLAIAAWCVLGMLIKVTVIFAVVLAAASVTWVSFARRGTLGRRILSLAPGALLVAAPALATGWFYVRNHRSSGTWYRSTPKVQVGTRPLRTTADGLADPDFYLVVPSRLFGKIRWDVILFESRTVSIAACALAVFVGVGRLVQHGRIPRLRNVLVAGILTAHLGLLYLAQLSHISGYGALNYRYFLPATLSIAALLAVGVLGLGRAGGIAFASFLALAIAALVVNIVAYSRERFPTLVEDGSWWEVLRSLAVTNGVPTPLVTVLLVTAGAAATVAVWTVAALPTGFGADGSPARETA